MVASMSASYPLSYNAKLGVPRRFSNHQHSMVNICLRRTLTGLLGKIVTCENARKSRPTPDVGRMLKGRATSVLLTQAARLRRSRFMDHSPNQGKAALPR